MASLGEQPAVTRSAFLEHEVYSILNGAGISSPRHLFLRAADLASASFGLLAFLESMPSSEVVVKIVSSDIAHKSEAGGVRICRRDPHVVADVAAEVWRLVGERAPAARREGVLIAEKLPVLEDRLGQEFLLSYKQDPAFGPVIVFGLGGLLTEWYGEFSKGDSTAVLEPLRIASGLRRASASRPAFSLLFNGSRAHPRPILDLETTAARLERFASAVTGWRSESGSEIAELEVNPVLARGDDWIALDGKGKNQPPRPGPRPSRPLEKIGNLLRPKSAAVAGASASSMNPGRIILRNLKTSEGVTYGHLYAIHPSEQTIDGIPCFRSPAGLPEKVDMAVISIPAEGAVQAIRGFCESGKAESMILIPGGFAETGRRDLEEQIRTALDESRLSEDGGPVLLGGNCLGVVSKRQYNTFFLPQYKLPFHDAPGETFAAISQSGAYLVSLTSNLDGIIYPRASISYGNQVDLTVSDLLTHFLKEEGIRVVACYIEGFAPLDGARFASVVRQFRQMGRRVIVFKAGKTQLGAKATQSHTASLAGDYAVARALLEDAGAIVTETLDMFEDYSKALTMLGGRPAAGNRVAIISNAGFECSSVLDSLYGMQLAALSDATLSALRACLPSIAHADNPIDATPMATTPQFIEAIEALERDPGVDTILISPIPVTPALDDLAPSLWGTHTENIYSTGSFPQELVRIYRASKKPMVVNVDSGSLYEDFVMVLQRGGIPVFRKIDRASRALSAFCQRI